LPSGLSIAERAVRCDDNLNPVLVSKNHTFRPRTLRRPTSLTPSPHPTSHQAPRSPRPRASRAPCPPQLLSRPRQKFVTAFPATKPATPAFCAAARRGCQDDCVLWNRTHLQRGTTACSLVAGLRNHGLLGAPPKQNRLRVCPPRSHTPLANQIIPDHSPSTGRKIPPSHLLSRPRQKVVSNWIGFFVLLLRLLGGERAEWAMAILRGGRSWRVGGRLAGIL